MRKLLLFLTVVIALVACEGKEGPMGPQGPPGEDSYWYVEKVIVRATDWELSVDEDGLNGYYIAIVDIPEITKRLYDGGKVDATLYTIDEFGNEVQNVLPYVYQVQETRYPNWTEVVRFDYTVESVAFYVSYSDFNLEFAPGEMQFRVIVTY